MNIKTLFSKNKLTAAGAALALIGILPFFNNESKNDLPVSEVPRASVSAKRSFPKPKKLETSANQKEPELFVTEWHPTLFSPVRIVEPNRLIQYTYDAQGRQLSQTIISR